ncbi:unnamed protein product [Mytilus coruscus]|uniref:Uncharacterized protein n=1 Tax=Mytilus coruscus TaxID=42192 RepID=A0A6J8C360_MYTCO|nr:unnamed protein product [Mytilus coruscus]
MIDPTPFGMVIPTPCVEIVAHPDPYNVMPPTFDPSLILKNAYPGVPAVQNNNTVHSNTSRRTPCLEEVPDNTQLVRRKPSTFYDVDYTRPKPVQKDTYKMNSIDCKKYLENIGKEIVSDSKKEFTNFVKNFDSNELKKRRDLEDKKKEKERKEREETEEAFRKIDLEAIGKYFSSTRLFKALRYTTIPGERSQAILDAVDQSWCISDTGVRLIFYGNKQPRLETRISTRGGNRLDIHVHEKGSWNLEWTHKTCTKECIDGISVVTSVFPFDYIAGGFNMLSYLFIAKK